MRIVHIADTHFGKQLKKINFAEQDQPYWIEAFVAKMDELQPDAVVIAGDIFDVKMPGEEATKLWDMLLNKLFQRKIKVFAVPGNHDQAARIGEKSSLLDNVGVYMAGRLQKEMPYFDLKQDAGECVRFWLLPYAIPSAVGLLLDRKDIVDYNTAIKEYLAAQPIDYSKINVLVAHQNVLSGGEERILNDNERSIGFSGEVDCHILENFDYVALGHIHAAQHVGSAHIRYAGAPLQYDFSEEGRWRGFVVVDIKAKGEVEIEKVELPPLHQMVVLPPAPQKAATLEELLELGNALEDKAHKYIKARIWREGMPHNAQIILEKLLGDKLELEPVSEEAILDMSTAQATENMSMEEAFKSYYGFISQGEELSPVQLQVIREIMALQSEEGLLKNTNGKAETEAREKAASRLVTRVEQLAMAAETANEV